MLIAMFVAAMFFSGCTYGNVNYQSKEGGYNGRTTLSELSRAVYLDRVSAAEADRIQSQARLTEAFAEAVKKKPELAAQIPLPGNPNDARFIGRSDYNETGDCKGNCGGSNYGDHNSFDNGLRQAMSEACRRNPNQPGCR